MADSYHVIYSAANSSQAHLLKDFLRQRGIFALVQNEALQVGIGELPPGYKTSPAVVVAPEHTDRARSLINEFETTLHSQNETTPIVLPSTSHDSWPRCPGCGKNRQTICPICGEKGQQLTVDPLAFSEPGSETDQRAAEDRLTLICPLCDEIYLAQFYRHCEWCNHDWGTGIEVNSTSSTPVTRRERLVIAILIGTTIILLLYFSWLFQA